MSAVYDIVIPSVGRDTLLPLLRSLPGPAEGCGRVVLVDDRLVDPGRRSRLGDPSLAVTIVSGGGGPACARNLGARATTAPWIVFLDDDVALTSGWEVDLLHDLADADPGVVAVQGRVRVPLDAARRPTDWERNVSGLETARWITADLAVRRTAFESVDGFDERFRRAYREDSDLAIRLRDAGGRLTMGRRAVLHPPRTAPWYVSVSAQRGNADDALMRSIHGRCWRELAGAPRGAFASHVAVAALEATAFCAALAGKRSAKARSVSAVCAAGAVVGIARFAVPRIAPGPRTAREILAMIATSIAIPPAAVFHRLRGVVAAHGRASHQLEIDAVLFDRDGTLVVDVPYNGEPERVSPVTGAAEAIARLRSAGLRLAMVTNQSAIARGLLKPEQVDAVNRRVEAGVGTFDAVLVCPHDQSDGCSCRKPRPGMVLAAASRLGVDARRCVVIGDIGSDVEAALAAGSLAILVPTAATEPDEIEAAVRSGARVATSLSAAVDQVLSGRVGAPGRRKR